MQLPLVLGCTGVKAALALRNRDRAGKASGNGSSGDASEQVTFEASSDGALSQRVLIKQAHVRGRQGAAGRMACGPGNRCASVDSDGQSCQCLLAEAAGRW